MRQSGSGTAGGITVHWPDSFSDRTYYSDFKGPGAAQNLDAGVFGSGSTRIDSTYDFRARDASGNAALPGIIAGGNICIAYADVKSTGNVCDTYDETGANTSFATNTISILGITELRGTGNDLNGTGHLTVLTNGSIGRPAAGMAAAIPFAEYRGDLRIGLVDSTQSDVVLASSRAILDGINSGATAGLTNISAHDITLTSGDNLISADTSHQSGAGGVGTPADFLQIHVNAHGSHGVLTVTDTGAPRTTSLFPALPLSDVTNVPGATTGTFGVFITEATGDMTVNTVTTNANVSLRTLGGSILDGRNSGSGLNTGIVGANVVANNIDLLARRRQRRRRGRHERSQGLLRCERVRRRLLHARVHLLYQDENYASATSTSVR